MQTKTDSAWELGKGKPNGGGDECKKARAEVLQRLRSVAKLSPEQVNDWGYFVTSWDREMANEHGEEWGTAFVEMMQDISNKLAAGNKNEARLGWYSYSSSSWSSIMTQGEFDG